MANKISVLIDVAVDGATRNLKSFRSAVADADTVTGKFKAGAGAAMDSVKANAANLAMAGGAALIAFGVKSVGAFQETALEAGKLRDSLGVTSEEASRLMEVAEDLGIGTATLEKSIGIMNRTATNTPGAFSAIGAELKKNADGTTNVNATFLSTIDALKKIPDASQRAAAAQKVFGRGWMEMAELIELGADGVERALASVENGKIIDDGEVERARKFRDSLDELRGIAEEFAITVGGVLVPALTAAADTLVDLKGVAGDADAAAGGLDEKLIGLVKTNYKLFNPVSQARTAIGFLGDQLGDTEEAAEDATEAIYGTAASMIQASIDTAVAEKASAEYAKMYVDHAAGMQRASQEMADELAADLARIERKWDSLLGKLSERSAYLDAEDGFDAVQAAAEEAYIAAATGADSAEVAARDYERAQIDLTGTLADYAQQVGDIPPEKITEIQALIDAGKLAEAEAAFERLTRVRQAKIDITSTYTPSRVSVGGRSVVMHDGGIVGGQSFAGLRNDEVPAVLQKGEAVLTEGQQAALGKSGGGGGTTYVTINTQADPQMVIDAIRKWERRNGGLR